MPLIPLMNICSLTHWVFYFVASRPLSLYTYYTFCSQKYGWTFALSISYFPHWNYFVLSLHIWMWFWGFNDSEGKYIVSWSLHDLAL